LKRFNSRQILKIKDMRADGYTHLELAKIFKTSKSAVFYHTSNLKISKRGKKRLSANRKKISAKIGLRRRFKVKERSRLMTKARARLVAHLLGDGGIYENEICYKNTEPFLVEQFIKDFQTVYGVNAWRRYWDGNKFGTGSGIVEVAHDLYRYRKIKGIHPEIIGAGRQVQREFIRAFADDEGGPISRNRVRITSTNWSYLNGISKMLANFGIVSVINGAYHRGEYLLDVNRKESVVEYIRRIGFLHPQKIIRAKQILFHYPKT